MKVSISELRDEPLMRGCMSGTYPLELHQPDLDQSLYADTESELLSLVIDDYPLGELLPALMDGQAKARRKYAVDYATALQRDVIERTTQRRAGVWARLSTRAKDALESPASPRYLMPRWRHDIHYVVVASTALMLRRTFIPQGTNVVLIDDTSEDGLIRSLADLHEWRYIVNGVAQ